MKCLLPWILQFAISASSNALVEEQILVITRHGIRVPFPPLEKVAFSLYSTDSEREWFTNFSDWGADQVAGLTDHGREVIRKMGAHFGETLLKNLSKEFFIYSSVDSTKRDIKTAISFFKGAYPDVNVTEADMFGPGDADQQTYIRTLLNQGDINTPQCVGSATLPDVIKGETGGDLSALSLEQQENVMEVSDYFSCCQPELCKLKGDLSPSGACTLMNLRTDWEGQKFYWEDFTGPMTVAAKLMEYVQLVYLNGMDWKKLVPDMTETGLAKLMHLHEESMSLADDYWNAQHSGSELLVHMAATMQQYISGTGIKGLQSKPSAAFVYYAAHDINIYLIRQLLRLNWMTESFNPNQSPPGGMLFFVLLSAESAGAGKSYYVKAFFMTQSMKQQRESSTLSQDNPASRVFAVIPGCAHGPELSCPFEDFKTLVLKEIKRECVQLVDPDVLAATNSHHFSGIEVGVVVLLCAISLLLGLLLSYLVMRLRVSRGALRRNAGDGAGVSLQSA